MVQSSDTPSPKKLHIKTFGCQMNAYDSERMAEALQPAGFQLTEQMADADLVILNTCHIREKAAEKVYSELGRVRKAKEARKARGQDTMIAVAGCVAQAEGLEIIARAPVVDIIVGPQSYHRLGQLVAEAASSGKRSVETEFPAEDKFAELPARTTGKRQVSAFVTVQEGCDKFCTFCVVPYTRGAEYSRTPGEIVAEVERLAARGVREVTLLGQNVNAYHGDGPDGAAWSLAQPVAAAGGDSLRRAPALHHQPSPRHGRRTDRAVRRREEADALLASAVSIGIGPHPRGHEPQAHGGRL